MTIGKIFMLFMFYSVIGWLIEVICKRIEEGKFINRGFLIGPYLPIYGSAGVIITLTLSRYYDSPVTLFVMAMFTCAILEYVTSYLLEKLFNARWWDYTKYKFNINGRICLETMLPFGLLGCAAIYLINPFFLNILSLISNNIINVVAIILALLFLFDLFVSLKIMSNFKNATIQFRNKDNTEEITKKVKELLSSKSFFNKRLIDAFPNVKAAIVNIKNELSKTKLELKITKKELKSTNKKLSKMEKKMQKISKKQI